MKQQMIALLAMAALSTAQIIPLATMYMHAPNCSHTEKVMQHVFSVLIDEGCSPVKQYGSGPTLGWMKFNCDTHEILEYALADDNCTSLTPISHPRMDLCSDSPSSWNYHQRYVCARIDSSLHDLIELKVYMNDNCDGAIGLRTIFEVGVCLSNSEDPGPHYQITYTNEEKTQASYSMWEGNQGCTGPSKLNGTLAVTAEGETPVCGTAQPATARRQLADPGVSLSLTRIGGEGGAKKSNAIQAASASVATLITAAMGYFLL